MTKILVCLLALFSCLSCRSQNQGFSPSPKREFRAVWIATVDNIDWPQRGSYDAETQKQEFINILNSHQQSGINALFVQVRPASDAFFAKSTEPWSEWLTGQQGKAPEPFYDPLEFMINEAHQRGFEFHAWLNLNRAVHKSARTVAADNISKTHPEWILTYDGQKLLNFGLPEVRQYITNVVVNVVKNYDVDGIHFDDYFYPYTAVGQVLRDTDTFRNFPNGFTDIESWRRNNTDLLIKQIADAIKATKPYVKFGISPFGVWRNKKVDPSGSETSAGQTSYDNLYADTRKWVQEGWIDYIAPQVYFSQSFRLVPYKSLVSWWTQYSFNRHLYIGQGAYRVSGNDRDSGWHQPTELPSQVRYNRQYAQIQGSIFFSSKSITNNPRGIRDSLRTNLYRYPALIPTMPWKDNTPPLSPQSLAYEVNNNGTVSLYWQAPEKAADGDTAYYYVVYRFEKGEVVDLSKPDHIAGFAREPMFVDRIALADKKYLYLVTAVDRLHNESMASKEVKVRTPVLAAAGGK
ncbi:MAG: family 10 glycosylhydrolase [Spirosomataceae bacterium]